MSTSSEISTEVLITWNPGKRFKVFYQQSEEMPNSPCPNDDDRLLWHDDFQENIASGGCTVHSEVFVLMLL